MFEIQKVDFSLELNEVLAIYHEYVNSTSVSLEFQNNHKDFEHLAKNYDNPAAGIFLARVEGQVAGCSAYRRIDDDTCEMKRVYVRPDFRGHRIGEALVERVLSAAKTSGYKKICLDVLPEFEAARALYKKLGFIADTPVTFNPIPDTAFLSLTLDD